MKTISTIILASTALFITACEPPTPKTTDDPVSDTQEIREDKTDNTIMGSETTPPERESQIYQKSEEMPQMADEVEEQDETPTEPEAEPEKPE